MIKLQRINTSHEHYPFVESLMKTAFPLQERRNVDLQREYTDNKPHFHTLVILVENKPIGLITYWKLDSFNYIEHFAIKENLRNKGYGQEALKQLKEEIEGMIVLEVEEPIDELTKRRIGFYQRQGFTIQDMPYLQPPYRKGDDWYPMKLMTLREEDFSRQYEKVKNNIYREAYNICNKKTDD